MHSKIFQLSTSTITVDDYVWPEFFYDNSQDFADYIGDAMEGDLRKDYIEYLANSLKDIFDFDGNAFIYKGMGDFLTKWADELKSLVNNINGKNILSAINLWKVARITETTHLDSDYRFFIEDWDDCAVPMSDLIVFANSQLKVGDRLYIGNVIDFHF